jgi:hypothetical protein
MMADKKVDRFRPEGALRPTQLAKSALPSPGTVNMAESTHDKGKSSILDKFRRREERWRREQSLRDREAADMVELPHHPGPPAAPKPRADAGPLEGGAK